MTIQARRQPGPPDIDSLAGDWLEPPDEEAFALPTLANPHGMVQVAWGPTGIQNWIVPPTGAPGPTAQLYVWSDEGARPVPLEGTRYRWWPYRVERDHPVVASMTTLHEDGAVSEELTFHRPGRYLLVFGGFTRTWSFTDYWNLPPEDVPQFSLVWDSGSILMQDTKTFGCSRFVPDSRPKMVRAFRRRDDLWAGRETSGRGRYIGLEFDVVEGDRLRWAAAQGVSKTVAPISEPGSGRERWSSLWEAAFTPGNNEFSGHLPALDFGDAELNRLYYMSTLACLYSLRVALEQPPEARFATGGQAIWADAARPLARAYTWGGSEGAPTTSFLWETQLQAAVLARLDPDTLRAQLEAFLRADMGSHWGVDMLTGRGVGMWYGVNDGAIINACADYVRHSGDVAWLGHTVEGVAVRDHLLHHLQRLDEPSEGGPLTDFGTAENILECVGSYEHRIASFNAMSAWCHRYAADVLDPGHAKKHRERAEAIETAVRQLLHPAGYFTCEGPDGAREVRTCLDFIYVGRFMGDRLAPQERASMLAFFKRELETSDWMRALSLEDGNAFTRELPYFQTFRADHQASGSYDGWPGWAAAVRMSFGDETATLAWLKRMSAVTREGPFGQAHWTGLTYEDGTRPAVKADFFNGNCSLESCGVTLAGTLLDLVGL